MFRSVTTTMGTVINKWPRLFLLLLLVLMSLAYNYHKIIELPPRSIHQWRQADCASFAYTYYSEDRSFFEPAVLNGGKDGTGRTVSEFPILYFIVGNLWQLFGHHDWMFRIVNLCIVFIGLISFVNFTRVYLKDMFWSIFIPLLLFTSPLLVYYANNFIANAPAFGLALVAWGYFGKFYQHRNSKYLIYSMLFFAIGGLIKITSSIGYVAIFGTFIIESLGIMRFEYGNRIFRNPKKQLFIILLVPVIIVPWYLYARYYNSIHTSGFFLQGILPFWELEPAKFNEIANKLYLDLLPSFFNKNVFLMSVLLFLINVIFFKKANRYLVTLSVFLFIGVISFLLLFYQVFDVHDYYLTNLLIFPMIVFITTLNLLKKHYSKVFLSWYFKSIAVMILLLLVYITTSINRMKYSANDNIALTNPFVKNSFKEYMKYHHWKYQNTLKPLEEITPYLRNIGINEQDLILCYPDQSFNIGLYLMKQRGYETHLTKNLPEDEKIKKILSKNIQYLVIFDPMVYDWDFVKPLLDYKIGEYKNVDIYDLRPYDNR